MTRAELIQFINANIYPNGRNQITAPMVRDSILAVVGFLGDAAVKDIGAVLENNTDLVTGGAVYDAIRAYLSSVMKMVGETTTDVITNPTANPVYVDGEPHSAQKGDVVVYGYKEFWWTGSLWKELGDEASWALKTITITGTGDLTGGGSLEANRTLDLTQSAKDKLAHGETAFSWLESYSTNRLRLKSPYSYLNARKGLILEEETDYTNTPADFVKQVVTIGETEYTILRSKLPIVSDSFISAGGISPGGGASGTTLQAVWDSLATNTGDYANAKIHSGHIPLGSGLGVDGSGNIYVTSQGTVTGIKIGSTTYTPSAGSTIVDISAGIPTSMAWSAITSTPTTLAGYGITDAKIESGVITLGSSTITPLTSHQTIYNLVINNSAGTAQITYKPNVSGTYSLTLTSAMVGLGNVENTALSTWAGTSNITTLGTISTGVWQGTAIGYNYVAAHYIGRTRTTASAAQATLLGIDAISNASSSGSSDASRIVWDSTNNAWHFLGGIYADSFISAGGLSSGGGTPGIDLAAMWASLQNNDIETTYDSYKIHTNHLPAIVGASGISASYRAASSGSGLADYLDFSVNASTLKSALAISTSDVSGLGTMATQSASDYLLRTGGTMSGTITTTATIVQQVNALNNDTWIWNVTDTAGQARRYGYGLLYEGSGSGIANYLKLYAGNQAGTEVVSICVNQSGQIGVLTTPSTSYSVNVSGALHATTIYENGTALSTSYQAKVSALGSSTNPVYVSAAGTFSTCGFSVNTGMANTLAYYSDAGTISSLSNITSAAAGYILTLNSGSSAESGIKFARGTNTGWGIYVSSGNLTFVDSASGTDTTRLVLKETIQGGTATFSGGIVASSISKSGGASTEFLKADGSIDSTAYLPLSGGTMTGKLTAPSASFGEYHEDAYGVVSVTRPDDDGYSCYSFVRVRHTPYGLGYDSAGSLILGNPSSPAGKGWTNIYLKLNTDGAYYGPNGYTIYHSGNCNKSDVAWEASSLTLNGSISGVSSINGRVSFPTSSSNNPVLNIQGVSSTGTDWLSIWVTATHRPLVFQYNAGNVGIGDPQPGQKLSVAGNIVATGAITAGSASSREFKDNAQNMSLEYARNIIMSSRPITFQWNALAHSLYDKYEGDGIGFIAQEAEQLMPFAVSPIFEKYKRLDYTAYVSPLVRMSQYLLTTTDNHETRIQQLERESREKDAKIAELENTIARLTN